MLLFTGFLVNSGSRAARGRLLSDESGLGVPDSVRLGTGLRLDGVDAGKGNGTAAEVYRLAGAGYCSAGLGAVPQLRSGDLSYR